MGVNFTALLAKKLQFDVFDPDVVSVAVPVTSQGLHATSRSCRTFKSY
jgi:hypothetical protein